MKPAHLRCVLLLAVLGCSGSPSGPPDGPVGSFKVTATTVGPGATPTLLQLLVDDDPAVIIDANGTHEFEAVSVGDLVARVVIPGHCTADHYAPRTVEIEEGEVTELSWAVRCPLPLAPGMVFHTSIGTRELWVTDQQGGSPQRLESSASTDRHSPVANPARTRIAYLSQYGSNAGTPHIIDANGSHDIALPWGLMLSIDWSPDGSRLAITEGKEIHIIWPDGALDATIVNPQVVQGVRWSPDGTRLAYRAQAYMYVLDLTTGNRTNLGRILYGGGGLPAWSPDGSRMAFTDPQSRELWTIGADGSNPELLVVEDELHHTVDWHSDGRLLFGVHDWNTGQDELRTVPATGGTPTVLEGLPNWAVPGRWLP